MDVRELRARKGEIVDQLRAMVEAAETEDRDLNESEAQEFDSLQDEAETLEKRIKRMETIPPEDRGGRMPAYIKGPRGDNEANAYRAYFKFGDAGGLNHLRTEPEMGEKGPALALELPLGDLRRGELRAVDSTMNITTSADGGATVPTGLAPRIAQRMGEMRLTDALGCQFIPGVGTTVNHTYENAAAVIFATTSEQADDGSTNNYERDAMVLANKAFTLVKKTKKIHLTEELLDDTGENLMEAIADWVGRGIALTHNSALITEAAASGTSLKTFASATAIAAGEPEDIVYNDTVGYYMDDGGRVAWVMRPSTFGNIASLTGNARLYAETPAGSFARELLGYPAYYSNYAAATAASAKDVYFGNWFYMGYREEPALRFLRDPYTIDGVVQLKYSFRIVYGVLIAGAIGYGVHPSA